MQLFNTTLDFLFYRIIYPLILFIRNLFDLVILDTLTTLNLPPAWQVIIVAALTALAAFALRKWLKVEEKNKRFKKAFVAERKQRDTIGIIEDKKARDAMYESADQTIDEGFNTYLAQHYFHYVLVYLLPLFLVMAWLNSSLNEDILPTSSGQPYLFLLPSHPMGMDGISVTLLFLLSYILFLIIGFQLFKYGSAAKKSDE